VLWQGVRGVSNLKTRDEITPETVFDIGSVAKQFTATAILLLVQAGRLRLDDALSRHLDRLPPWSTTVTLEQLMHHTSGVPDYLSLLADQGHPESDLTTRKQALAILQTAKLGFTPGSDWEYSNSNYLLLGEVVRKVSGKSLPQFVQERIFRPLTLDMVMDPTASIPRKAVSYRPGPSSGFTTADVPYQQVGDAGVQTTPAELVRWADNYRTGKVGGRDLTRAVLEDAADSRRGDGVHYGAGIAELPDGSLWHNGIVGGFLTDLWVSRDRRTSVAIACNRDQLDTAGMRETISDIWSPH
jgi:CubicO group peptidase (beta-lactamase class C family)